MRVRMAFPPFPDGQIPLQMGAGQFDFQQALFRWAKGQVVVFPVPEVIPRIAGNAWHFDDNAAVEATFLAVFVPFLRQHEFANGPFLYPSGAVDDP